MANTKLNILEHPKRLLLFVVLIMAAFVFVHAPRAHAAAGACPTPATDMGSVSSSISVTTAGTYRVWSRMTNGTASTDNSYSLEIDGNSCYVVGDASTSLPSTFNNDSSNWVNYQNGTTSSTIDVSLTAGTHTIRMIGREDGVKLDRVGFTTDTACIPTGTGDNCFPPADTTPPVASITSPAANAKVRGTVNVTATASDDSGTVSQVQLYVDGAAVGTPDTTAPYNFNWNTTGLSNGSHTIAVVATDPSNNSNQVSSSSITVTVDNSPPTVSLTAPANNASITTGSATVSSTFSDNNAVTSIGYSYSGAGGSGTISSVNNPTSPNSVTWNTSGITNGSYTLTATATDGAGNQATSSITVTISNSSGPDTTPPTTSITPPSGNQSGTIIISTTASDNVGVTKVELYIDGWLAATDSAAPYSYSWNTNNWSNATHVIKTIAYDAAGNTGSSSNVNVTVANSPSTYLIGDINHSGPDGTGKHAVNALDLGLLLSNWNKTGMTYEQGNTYTTGDTTNVVNGLDLGTLLGNWNN